MFADVPLSVLILVPPYTTQTRASGNTQIAVITGLFDADTYGWRSMTTPGITGLYNKNCLKSAMDNLITCAPGDNTYIGAPTTTVSLISEVSQFHSIYTTEETNGRQYDTWRNRM